MTTKYLMIVEHNGWERESWNYFIKHTVDKKNTHLFRQLDSLLTMSSDKNRFNTEKYFARKGLDPYTMAVSRFKVVRTSMTESEMRHLLDRESSTSYKAEYNLLDCIESLSETDLMKFIYYFNKTETRRLSVTQSWYKGNISFDIPTKEPEVTNLDDY